MADRILYVQVLEMGLVKFPVKAEDWAEGGFKAQAHKLLTEGITMQDITGSKIQIPPSQIKLIMESPPSAIAMDREFRLPGSPGG